MRFSLIKKNKVFEKNYMKGEIKKLFRAGMVGSSCGGDSSHGKVKIEETDGSSSG